jgi:hypothetical protein
MPNGNLKVSPQTFHPAVQGELNISLNCADVESLIRYLYFSAHASLLGCTVLISERVHRNRRLSDQTESECFEAQIAAI